jgi:hypothetical protein
MARRPELDSEAWSAGLEVASAGLNLARTGSGRAGEGGWLFCEDAPGHSRGYTCGLWLLFHTLATRAYVLGSQPDLSSPSPGGVHQPRDGGRLSAQALRGTYVFITHFFGCERCREHFLAAHPEGEIDGLLSKPGHGRAFTVMLWLYKAHNDVNQRLRLAQEEAETPWHGPFPSHAECPGCDPPEGVVASGSNFGGTVRFGVPQHLVAVYGFERAAGEPTSGKKTLDLSGKPGKAGDSPKQLGKKGADDAAGGVEIAAPAADTSAAPSAASRSGGSVRMLRAGRKRWPARSQARSRRTSTRGITAGCAGPCLSLAWPSSAMDAGKCWQRVSL